MVLSDCGADRTVRDNLGCCLRSAEVSHYRTRLIGWSSALGDRWGPYREIAGLERYDLIRARHIGAMISAKASLCQRLARGNLWFAQLSSKRQTELEKLFGEESKLRSWRLLALKRRMLWM